CGANQTPQICTPMGTWESEAKCTYVCTGQGVCGGHCTPGTGTCMGLVHYSCGTDGELSADAGNQCKTATGGTCGGNGECISGFCVGNICCNSSCIGTCQSCALVDTGVATGTCGPVQSGRQAPSGQCTA